MPLPFEKIILKGKILKKKKAYRVGAPSVPYQTLLNELLADPREAADYLNAALADDDPRVFLLALRNVAEAHGMTNISREASLNRESLYKLLSEKGNPRLSSIIPLLRAMNLRLVIGNAESSVKRKTRKAA
jgi:probable addiction module antidote protein